MNTNLVQIDPATLSAIQSLPPQYQHWVIIAVCILSVVTMLGRAATALINDAPVLKSVFMGSVHALPDEPASPVTAVVTIPDPTSAVSPLVDLAKPLATKPADYFVPQSVIEPVTSPTNAAPQAPAQTVGVVTVK